MLRDLKGHDITFLFVTVKLILKFMHVPHKKESFAWKGSTNCDQYERQFCILQYEVQLSVQ